MATAFNLTAQLNLRGPNNVNKIVADIKKQLSGITANVNLKLDPNVAKNVKSLDVSLKSLNSTLARTATQGSSAASAIASFGRAVNSVNIKNIPSQINATISSMNKLNKSGSNTAQSLTESATEMQEFGKQAGLAIRRFAAFSAVTGVIYSLSNSINQGVQAFIEYDKELVRLQQVTGQTAGGLKSLQDSISQLATGLGVSSKELTTVSVTLAQAGLSAKDTERALRALALSSLAPSFDNMNETVEGSIALMRQFGISAGQLEQALGSINAVAAAFAVEADDLITAIQRTGGVFATASKGVSEGTDALNEFISVFTSVRATTRESAETIATGLRTIFTRIQRGGTIDALKEFGVTLTDSEGKFVGAYKAVQLLSEGLSKLDPRDIKFSRIVEELGGFRQIGKVIPLIQQFAVAQSALKIAQTGQASLAKDSATAQLSLANKIQKVREEFFSLFREIGQSKGFQSLVSGVLTLTRGLIKLADVTKSLLPALSVVLAFKGASALTQFASGFSKGFRPGGGKPEKERPRFKDGGQVRYYAKGGHVAGSGSSDTVPAMLTPGEFVINKKAARAVGSKNLNRLNRYARGGSIQRFQEGSAVRKVFDDTNSGSGVQKSHIGADIELTKTEIQNYAKKYKNKQFQRSVTFAGYDLKNIQDGDFDASAFISKIGLKTKERVLLNLPSSFNQALRTNDRNLVSADGLVNYLSKSNDIFVGKYKNTNQAFKKQDLITAVKALKSKAKKYSDADRPDAESFDYDYELNSLKSVIANKAELDQLDLLFKPSLEDAAYRSKDKETGQRTGPIRYRTQSRSTALRSKLNDTAQKLANGGVVQRKVGYIDYDVIANADNETVVKKGMEATGMSGPRLYTDYLTQLAVKVRKDSNLQKLRAIYGVAGSGKTTLARGQGTDNAKLRQTERFPILSPEDIQRATEVIVLSSSVSKDKLDNMFDATDRTYTLSSTTKKEQENIGSNRESRDATGVGLENRKPGSTRSVAKDSAVGEALLSDRLGDRSTVLTRSDSGKLRRKQGNELVEIVKKKIGFTWGGYSPMTAGHESILDAAGAMGISPEDFVFMVGSNEGIVPGKEQSYRTAIFDQDTRVLLAKAGAGARGATVLPKPRDFEVPQAFDLSETGQRRKVLIPGKGSTTFVADKTPEETEKYKKAGYKVQHIERTGGISGTMVRDLIKEGNLGELQKVLSPGVYDLISNNIGRIQNRANILPSIIEEVQQTQGMKLADVEKQIKAVGISRIDSKQLASDPEYAAKVEVLKELREKRDQIKSSASFEPHRLLAALAAKQPEKYGLDLSTKSLPEISPIRTVGGQKSQKANIGGLIQKFMAGGIAEESERMTDTLAATKSRKEILDLLKSRPNGLQDTAKQVGVSTSDIFGILGAKDPDARTKTFQEAIRREYVKTYNRQAGAKKATTTKLENKDFVFGAAGVFGSASAPENIDIISDRLSKSAKVRVVSGVMDKSRADQLDALINEGTDDIAARGARLIKGSEPTGSVVKDPSTQGSMQGIILEQIIQRLGGPGKVKGQGFDFPNGLKDAAQYFSLPPDIPTDLKRTLEGPSTIKDNIVTYLKNVMGYAGGGKVDYYSLEKNSGFKSGEFDLLVNFAKTSGFSLDEFKKYLQQRSQYKQQNSGLRMNPASVLRAITPEAPKTTDEQRALADQLKGEPDAGYRPIPTAAERIASDRVSVRNATRGFANGGAVPALLTPGEAVIPPGMAKKIGYGKLSRMNKADSNGMGRYASGGGVGIVPGSGNTDSFGPVPLPVGSFVIRKKATEALGFNRGGSVPVQRFAAGGGVTSMIMEWLSSDMTAGTKPKMAPRPDVVNRSSVVASNGTTKALDTLVKALNQLGLSAANSAEILNKGGQVSYKTIQKALAEDIKRLKISGASIQSIVAAETTLANIRKKSREDVTKQKNIQGLTSLRGNSSTKIVGGQTIGDLQAGSGAGQQAIETQAQMLAQARIKRKGGKVTEKQRSDIMQSSYVDAASRVTGIKKKEFKSAGISGGDIQQYIADSMKDRKSLSQMDKQLITLKTNELTNSAAYIAASNAEQKRMLTEVQQATKEEISTRRKIINDLAAQNGTKGVGAASMTDFKNSPILNQIKGFIKSPGRVMGGVSVAAGLTAGSSDMIAKNMYNMSTTEGQGKAAKTSAAIQSSGTILSTGMAAASQMFAIPVIGPYVAAITAVGTAAVAAADYFYDFTGAQKAASVEFERAVRAKEIGIAMDGLDRAFQNFEKDVGNINLQKALEQAIGNTSSLQIKDNMAERDNAKAEFALKNRSFSDLFSGNFKGSAKMDALEQGAMDSGMSQKLAPIADKAMSLYGQQINSGKTIEDIVSGVRTGNEDAVNTGAAVAFNVNPKLWSELESKVKASGDSSASNVLKIKREITARELLTNAELQSTAKRAKLDRDMEASNRAGRRLAETFEHISDTIDQSIQRMQRESEVRQAQAKDRVEARRGNAGFDEKAVDNRNVGVLTSPKAYQNDPRRIEEAIRAGTTGMAPELAQKMAGGARLEATLPNVMRNAISTGLKDNANLDLDGAATAARRRGTEAIRNSGLSEADQKVAIDKLNSRIADETKKVQDNEKGGTAAEQVDAFADSISELGPEIANMFGNAGKRLDDIIQARQGIYNTFAKNLEAVSEAAKKAREFFSKARDIRYDGGMDLREAQTGVGESYAEAKTKSDSSIARLTGGVTDPQAIGRNIDGLMAQRDQQMKNRDTAASNPALTQDQQKEAVTKFTKDIQATNNALNDNREALDKLANSADVAQKALDEVKNVKGLQQDRENFVNQLLTNTPEEADKLNQSFIRLQRNLSGGLNNASNQRDARNTFNDTLRRTGSLREATRAGNTVLADQRKQTLQLMQDPGFRGMMTLNMKNQAAAQGKNLSDTDIEDSFKRREGMLMQQMAVESGMINNPMVRQALAVKQQGPNADPAMRKAAEQFLQSVGLQAKATEEQGRLELANVQSLLTTATVDLRSSIETLTATINTAMGNDGQRIPGAVAPMVPVPAGARVVRPAVPKSSGGIINGLGVKTQYASVGKLIDFSPKGTDTVPAMLTPGEFVVNARSTSQHLPLLKAINSGAGVDATSNMSKGGVVYLNDGGLLAEFQKIDANKSNLLESGEIDLQMIQRLDRDRDNKISFSEYAARAQGRSSAGGTSGSGQRSSVKSGFKAQDMNFEQYYNQRAKKYSDKYKGTGDQFPRESEKPKNLANGGMVSPYYLAEGTKGPLRRVSAVQMPPKKDPLEVARVARKADVKLKRRPSLVPGDPRAKDAEPSFFRLDLNEDGILDRKEGYPYQDLDKDKDGQVTQDEWKNNVLARARVRDLENQIKIDQQTIDNGGPVPVDFESKKRNLGFAKIDAGMAAAPGDNEAFVARQKRIDAAMTSRLTGGGSLNSPDGSYVFNRELGKINDRRSAFETERRDQRAKDENATDQEIFDRTVEAYGAGDSNYWRNSMGVTELPNVYDNSRTLDVIRNESDLSTRGDPNGEKTRAYIDGYVASQGARQQSDRVDRGMGRAPDPLDTAVVGTQGPVDYLNYLIDEKEKGRAAKYNEREERFNQENEQRQKVRERQGELDQRDKELGINTSDINRDIYESGGGFSNQPGSGRKVSIEEQKQRRREKVIADRFSFTDKTGKNSTTGTIDKVDLKKNTVRIAKIDPKTGEPKVGEKGEQIYTTVPLDKLSDKSRDKARSYGLEKEADKARNGENFTIGDSSGKHTTTGKIFRVDEKAGTAVIQKDNGKLVTVPLEKLAPESRNIALDQAKTANTVTDLTQRQMDADISNIDVTSSLPEPPIPLAEDFTDRANEIRQETMNNAAMEQNKPTMPEPTQEETTQPGEAFGAGRQLGLGSYKAGMGPYSTNTPSPIARFDEEKFAEQGYTMAKTAEATFYGLLKSLIPGAAAAGVGTATSLSGPGAVVAGVGTAIAVNKAQENYLNALMPEFNQYMNETMNDNLIASTAGSAIGGGLPKLGGNLRKLPELFKGSVRDRAVSAGFGGGLSLGFDAANDFTRGKEDPRPDYWENFLREGAAAYVIPGDVTPDAPRAPRPSMSSRIRGKLNEVDTSLENFFYPTPESKANRNARAKEADARAIENDDAMSQRIFDFMSPLVTKPNDPNNPSPTMRGGSTLLDKIDTEFRAAAVLGQADGSPSSSGKPRTGNMVDRILEMMAGSDQNTGSLSATELTTRLTEAGMDPAKAAQAARKRALQLESDVTEMSAGQRDALAAKLDAERAVSKPKEEARLLEELTKDADFEYKQRISGSIDGSEPAITDLAQRAEVKKQVTEEYKQKLQEAKAKAEQEFQDSRAAQLEEVNTRVREQMIPPTMPEQIKTDAATEAAATKPISAKEQSPFASTSPEFVGETTIPQPNKDAADTVTAGTKPVDAETVATKDLSDVFDPKKPFDSIHNVLKSKDEVRSLRKAKGTGDTTETGWKFRFYPNGPESQAMIDKFIQQNKDGIEQAKYQDDKWTVYVGDRKTLEALTLKAKSELLDTGIVKPLVEETDGNFNGFGARFDPNRGGSGVAGDSLNTRLAEALYNSRSITGTGPTGLQSFIAKTLDTNPYVDIGQLMGNTTLSNDFLTLQAQRRKAKESNSDTAKIEAEMAKLYRLERTDGVNGGTGDSGSYGGVPISGALFDLLQKKRGRKPMPKGMTPETLDAAIQKEHDLIDTILSTLTPNYGEPINNRSQAAAEIATRDATSTPIKSPIAGDEFEFELGELSPEAVARIAEEGRIESQSRVAEAENPGAVFEAPLEGALTDASSPEVLKASAEARKKLAAQKLAAKSPEQISVEKTYGPLYREAKKANDTVEMARIKSLAQAEFKKRSQEASTKAEEKKNGFLPVMGKVLKIAAPIGTAIGYGLGSLLTRDKKKEPQDPASKLKNASSLQEVYDLISANDRGTEGFSAVEIATKLREIDPQAYDKGGDEYVNLGELAGMPEDAYDKYLERLKDRAATAKPVNHMAPQQYGAGVDHGPSAMPTFDLTKAKTDAAAMREIDATKNDAVPMGRSEAEIQKDLDGVDSSVKNDRDAFFYTMRDKVFDHYGLNGFEVVGKKNEFGEDIDTKNDWNYLVGQQYAMNQMGSEKWEKLSPKEQYEVSKEHKKYYDAKLIAMDKEAIEQRRAGKKGRFGGEFRHTDTEAFQKEKAAAEQRVKDAFDKREKLEEEKKNAQKPVNKARGGIVNYLQGGGQPTKRMVSGKVQDYSTYDMLSDAGGKVAAGAIGVAEGVLPTIFGAVGAIGGGAFGALGGPAAPFTVPGGVIAGGMLGSMAGDEANNSIGSLFEGTSIGKIWNDTKKKEPLTYQAANMTTQVGGAIATGGVRAPAVLRTAVPSVLQGSKAIARYGRSSEDLLTSVLTGNSPRLSAFSNSGFRPAARVATAGTGELIENSLDVQNKARGGLIYAAEGMKIPRSNTILSSSQSNSEQYDKYATGGIVYANNGALINAQPMGTDTVPAMLTPGEFVVNRNQAQKHAPILNAINSGAYSRGGIVNYLANGGIVNPNYLSAGALIDRWKKGKGVKRVGSGDRIYHDPQEQANYRQQQNEEREKRQTYEDSGQGLIDHFAESGRLDGNKRVDNVPAEPRRRGGPAAIESPHSEALLQAIYEKNIREIQAEQDKKLKSQQPPVASVGPAGPAGPTPISTAPIGPAPVAPPPPSPIPVAPSAPVGGVSSSVGIDVANLQSIVNNLQQTVNNFGASIPSLSQVAESMNTGFSSFVTGGSQIGQMLNTASASLQQVNIPDKISVGGTLESRHTFNGAAAANNILATLGPTMERQADQKIGNFAGAINRGVGPLAEGVFGPDTSQIMGQV